MYDFVIKTGMADEERIAKRYAGKNALVLSGVQTVDSLELLVPQSCKAIISVGLCGGLAPAAVIGQPFIYFGVDTPDGEFDADTAWRKRLFAATHYFERHCYSSGVFNLANDEAQRAKLFKDTSCWIIDDESFVVAEFAKKRGMALAGLRTVSDGAKDDLPEAVVNALNSDGTTNLWAVIESVVSNPLQIPALFHTALEAKKSLDTLEEACRRVGPSFQWY